MPGESRRTPITVPLVELGAEAPASPERALGQLGRYELLALLAKGGMGEVFLARARGLGGFEKLVVVKRNLPGLDPAHQPLLAEARLAATLQHSNIVQVYDVEADAGTVFIAMEFLHGQDVRHVLRRAYAGGGRLPLEHAIAIALAVCAGLDYAHDKRDGDGTPLGIVHRDVSPSNVFVTYDGGVKLIDFGIAKATTLPSETQLGTVKGKPGYMSPEQCLGEPLDRRSDLFCVGILLYELTTGARPFRAESEFGMYKAIAELDPPRPSELDPSYPIALEAIVMRALHKERRQRHPSARAFQDELAAFAAEQRLDVSQYALARYMAALFRDELEAWHEARRTGQSLVQHVMARATSSLPAVAAPEPSQQATVRERPPVRSRRPLVIGAALAAIAIAGALVATRPWVDDPAVAPGAHEAPDAAALAGQAASDASPAAHDAGVPVSGAGATDAGTDAPRAAGSTDAAPPRSDPRRDPTRSDSADRPRRVGKSRPRDDPPADAPPVVDAGPGIDDPIP